MINSKHCQFPEDSICASKNCDPNANCVEVVSMALCICKAGWQGNGTSCSDINECETQAPCHKDAECRNYAGSYGCKCKPGFNGDGKSCTSRPFYLLWFFPAIRMMTV